VALAFWGVVRGRPPSRQTGATQAKSVSKSIGLAREESLQFPREVEQEMEKLGPGIDEGQAVGQFRQVCKQVGVMDLYFIYGVESSFIHPSVMTINAYAHPSGKSLSTKPEDRPHLGNFELLAACLIWAGQDLDRLIEGHPRAEGLAKLAASIGAKEVLPPYRTVPPVQRTKRRGNRSPGKNERSQADCRLVCDGHRGDRYPIDQAIRPGAADHDRDGRGPGRHGRHDPSRGAAAHPHDR
jgi:hypothetical protein